MLSYYQDAVATEAYLDTARERISVRRHARLVDYVLHEGCNARAWMALEVAQTELPLSYSNFYFIAALDAPSGPMLTEEELPRDAPLLVFEPLAEAGRKETVLRSARNEIRVYTWGDAECCLPKGATAAVLLDPGTPPPPQLPSGLAATGHTLKLEPCDVLIFEEVKGAKTGNPADADPRHRHAVRLTTATPDVDPLTGALIWDIEWAPEDALPFAVCVSSIGPAPECEAIPDVSVVRGNVLLVDHGRRTEDDLGQVPTVTIRPECGDPCAPPEVQTVGGPYAPWLRYPEISFAEPLPPCRTPGPGGRERITPASALLRQDPHKAMPQVLLYGIPSAPDGASAFAPDDLTHPERLARLLAPEATSAAGPLAARAASPAHPRAALEAWLASENAGPLPTELSEQLTQAWRALQQTWVARQDLLGSGSDDRHFVVEVDEEGRAHIRFGDGECGRRPDAGLSFRSAYRVGLGPAGNVGAEAINRIVFRSELPSGAGLRVRNPLPAAGGIAPEAIAEAKLRIPHAFRRTLQRAVTPADYAAIVMRDFAATVQRAAATLRWTGGGPEVLVAVDPLASRQGDDDLLGEIGRHLERFRRIGHDVRVAWAHQVALDVALTVCVLPSYLRGHVKAAVLDVLSARTLPDGRRGFFHPDSLTFGEGIYLSKLVAAVQGIAGVESVRVDRLERLYEGPNGEIDAGVLPLGPLEVARLDSDPSFPEHGLLTLKMGGGR